MTSHEEAPFTEQAEASRSPRPRAERDQQPCVPGLPLVEMKVLVSSLSQAPSQCRALSLSWQHESGATGARVLEARN